MSSRTEPPFRADHVGSLLRPPALLDARAQRAAGAISESALRAVEDSAIRDVIAMQQDVGLQSATDGEFRRAAWHMDFIYQLDGVTQADERLHVQFFNDGGTLDFAPERCTAGVLLHGGAVMALADSCGGVCAFLNLPEGAIGTATIESKSNFLRGVREGTITASTRPLHRGRTLAVLETEITRADGALVAKVTQTQAFHYPRA